MAKLDVVFAQVVLCAESRGGGGCNHASTRRHYRYLPYAPWQNLTLFLLSCLVCRITRRGVVLSCFYSQVYGLFLLRLSRVQNHERGGCDIMLLLADIIDIYHVRSADEMEDVGLLALYSYNVSHEGMLLPVDVAHDEFYTSYDTVLVPIT